MRCFILYRFISNSKFEVQQKSVLDSCDHLLDFSVVLLNPGQQIPYHFTLKNKLTSPSFVTREFARFNHYKTTRLYLTPIQCCPLLEIYTGECAKETFPSWLLLQSYVKYLFRNVSHTAVENRPKYFCKRAIPQSSQEGQELLDIYQKVRLIFVYQNLFHIVQYL